MTEHDSSSNGAEFLVEEDCIAGGGPVVVLHQGCNGDSSLYQPEADGYADEIDSTCSTPYVSAPSSPGRGLAGGCYFFSAPASPMHYILSTPPYSVSSPNIAVQSDASFNGSGEFEFSAKYASIASTGATGSMSSADELFLNGQIRPMKLSSHLQRPQILGPLLDVDEEEENAKEMSDPAEMERDLRIRSRSMHRRARSMSPSRNARFQWLEDDEGENTDAKEGEPDPEKGAEVSMPSVSASSSLSSSSGRNSKRWVFLKELLYRSKSEGRTNTKEKFWSSISFSPSKDKSKLPPTVPSRSSANPSCESSQKQSRKNVSSSTSIDSKKSGSSSSSAAAASQSQKMRSAGKRRVPPPSAHERLYTENRAQMEEMRKRTFLPYRQGLLGCLGFSSRSYGAMSGFTKTLKTVSSR